MGKKTSLSIRIFLSILFGWAAIAKLISPDSSDTLWSRYLGTRHFLAFAIITVELCIAIWFTSGFFKASAGLFCAFILACFTGILFLELSRRNPSSCGCFGVEYTNNIRRSLIFAVIRNLLLMAACCYLYVVERGITRLTVRNAG
jgi:hypothetical protein